MVSKGHVLVVDYDPQSRRVLRTTLEANGYEVEETTSGDGALEQCRTTKYDLILLELNLLGMSGFTTYKELRRSTDTRVVILTVRSSTEDKVEALDAGVSDYVTKPFEMGELLARIRAVLRRTPLPVLGITHLKLDDVEIDFESRRIIAGQQPVHLTPKEFYLLLYLASHPNRTIPYLELLQEAWGAEHINGRQHLRVFINRLRKKIEVSPRKPKFLVTDPSFGYRLQISG
jgi:two-component system KDP operon response regulator KdpE